MKNQIAIYLRLSLEDVDKRTNAVKDDSNSIASQRLLINRHLDQTPMLCDLPRIEFCDDGFSGTNFDRPDFQRMIECAKRGEISCIVVKDLSRFGRDYLEVGDYLEHIFPFLGSYQYRSGQERLPVSESAGQYAAAVAAPILCGGDVLGLVLFVSAEDRLPGEGEYKLAQAVAGFLGKHMEA